MDLNNIGKYWIKSSKFLLAKGKIYPSFYHYGLGQDIPSLDSGPVQLLDNNNLNTLFMESDFFYYLEKI
jgi:hypothetical protein